MPERDIIRVRHTTAKARDRDAPYISITPPWLRARRTICPPTSTVDHTSALFVNKGAAVLDRVVKDAYRGDKNMFT